MPNVQLPDGTEIEFPEGTDAATMNRVSAQTWARLQGGNMKAEAPKPDPYANLSLEEIQKRYQQRKFVGSKPEELAGIADAYVSREQSDRAKAGGVTGVLNAAENFTRDFARGVPIVGGALDEISAAGSAMMGGDYGEALDYQRARDRFNESQFGGLSTATQVGGGIASGVGAAKVLGLGRTGAVPARFMPTIPQALGSGAAGAGIGAADMFTRGEGGLENRAGNAAIGAVLGFPLGVASPYIAAGAAAGTQRLMDFLTSDTALRRLGISREAANILIRQLSTDDTLTATGAQRIRNAGPDAMLADAGQASENLLDTALQKSGPGSTAAREAIEQRAVAANRGLTQQLDTTFGPAVGVETRQAGIRQATAGARGAAYDDAYDAVIDATTPEGQAVAALWGRVRQPRRAAANALLEEAGLPIIEDGAMPTVRQLDYVTRALNTVARSAEGQGALGGINDVGRSAQNLAQELRQAARTAVPEYGVALDTAADPIRRIQAIEFGSTLLNSRVTREQVVQELRGASAAERRAMIQGVRDQLDEVVANVKSMASDPNIDARQLRQVIGDLSSGAAREKVTALLGQNQARAFFGQLGRFERAIQLRAAVARNSKTFARSDIDQQVKAQIEPGIIGSALNGDFAQAVKKAVQMITGESPERRLAMEDAIYGEIARALTTVRGQNAETMLRRLQAAIQARATTSRASTAAQRLTRGVTTVGGQSAAQEAATQPEAQ